jgi:hypothetical protein
MEILKKYKKQDDIIESEIYKNYLKKLSLYFNDETNSKYNKIEEENLYKLIDKKNDANIITIYKTKSIDLNIYLNNINNKINNIYKNISTLIHSNSNEDQDEKFNELKEEYSKIIIDKNDIMKIFKIQNKKIVKLQEDKINLIIKLYNVFNERKTNYKSLKPINKFNRY